MTPKSGSLCLAFAALVVSAAAQTPDPAEAKLLAIRELKAPKFEASKASDDTYWKDFQTTTRQVIQKRAKLILEFYTEFPTHKETPNLMELRWSELEHGSAEIDPAKAAKAAIEDINAILTKATDPRITMIGKFWRSIYSIRSAVGLKEAIEAFTAFIADYPAERDRGIMLIAQSTSAAASQDEVIFLYRRIVKDYPDSPQAKFYAGVIRQIESVGKPFGIKFNDLLSGREVDTSKLKGKVIMIEFYSSTFSQSAGRLPLLKMLRSELGPKGFEVISICLDIPDTAAGEKQDQITEVVRGFVKDNGIAWPVYWPKEVEKDWTLGWGVMSLPSVFIIDKKGNLRYTSEPENIKGELEKLLKEKG